VPQARGREALTVAHRARAALFLCSSLATATAASGVGRRAGFVVKGAVMLEGMRKRSRSMLIIFLFGIIIAAFIFFGPQSQGGGCLGGGGMAGGDKDDPTAASVDGAAISSTAFRAIYKMLGGGSRPQQEKMVRGRETTMDRLIERELLAEEAKRNGFAVTEDDVHKLLLDGRVVILGSEQPIPWQARGAVFSYDQFKSYSQNALGMSPATFIEQQERELLALRMRELLRASVQVSPDEVKAEYESRSRQVNLEYLMFPPRKYESLVEPSAQDIASYAAANEAKLKETFEQRKAQYTNIPAEIRVRRVLVKPAAPDKEAPAKKRAQDIAARINKGEPVAEAARPLPKEPAGTAPASADLGWKRKGTLGLDSADEDKVFAGAEGKAVGPIKTADGMAVFIPSGKREGTLTFDQVKSELAEEKIKQDKAPAVAKQKAEEALASIKASPDKTLKDLFPAPKTTADGESELQASGGGAADDPLRPRAEETGLFQRHGAMVGQIGESAPLAKAAFDLKPEAPVAGPFEVLGSQIVVRLKERKDPDPKELETKRPELTREAELVKWREVLTEFVRSRCLAAKAEGKIHVNRSVLRYEDGAEVPAYDACSVPPRRSAS
jgi:parvulin-like peptidyl-prolyl isomerase